MNYLIIGGTGFLSSRIVDHAIKEGNSVIAITRGERKIMARQGLLHVCADRDQCSAEEIAGLIGGQEWDVVIDAICRTAEHARQAISLAARCRRLVMISTDYVYSPAHRRLNQSEDDAVYNNDDSYGANKRRAELEILSAVKAGGVDATILRPPHIYGPGSNFGTIPNHGRKPELLEDITGGKTLHLVHSGLGLIQPIFVDDFARIILRIIPLEQSFGEIYNCPGNLLMTHADYYRQIGKCLGKDVTIEGIDPDAEKEISPFPCGHRYYDNSKIINLLRDFNYTSFEEGVQKGVAHLMSSTAAFKG